MLFTFPSRYWFTIGLPGVFSLTGWSPWIRTGFHVPRPTQDTACSVDGFAYGAITLSCRTFQRVLLSIDRPYGGPTTPAPPQRYWFGLFPFRSPLLRESRLISLPPGTEMFQFSGFASRLLEIPCLQHGGLPHSDTCGSVRACQSPQIFAACRVLHRLREPRHSPCALFYFRSILQSRAGCPARDIRFIACSRQALPRCLLCFIKNVKDRILRFGGIAEPGAASPTNALQRSTRAGDPRALRHRGCSSENESNSIKAARVSSGLQKGGVPAAPSGTATLLRLSPSHQLYPRPLLAVTDFRSFRLPWLDGRCVQGPGTYSPRRG